jgi:uncharacterized membrane protein (DUF485 family)
MTFWENREPVEDFAVRPTRNSRIGLALFAVYLMFYCGFVLVSAFAPESMEVLPLAGVNLAVWYGFGLIILAIALAIVYGWACRAREPGRSSDCGAPGGRP